MKHFDISEWTDFVRGVTSDRSAMEAHASRCVRCRATVSLVTRIVQSARTEGQYEPPDRLVRWAKAISALQRPERSSVLRLVARLVYDSFREPLPAGLRAADRVSRHALYEAGNFSVDLRLEQEKGSRTVTLVGQLTNREAPDASLPEAPVLLMARQDIIAHAVYNRFGEFQLEYPPARHLRLCVALNSPGKRIEVPLTRLTTGMQKPLSLGPIRARRPAYRSAGQRPK